MSIKVGVQIFVKPDVDIYEQIKATRALGFDNAQLLVWNVKLYTDELAEKIMRACRDFDFKITGLWCGWFRAGTFAYPEMYETIGFVPVAYRDQRTRDFLLGAEFARKIGVRDVITHMGFLPDDPNHEDRLGAMVAIKHICKMIAPFGQRFLFETGEELPTSLVQFIKSIGEENIGINLDPANMLINGRGNSYDTLCMFAPYVYGFHAKDGVYPKNGEPKGHEVLVGTGEVNFPKLIDKLTEIGYDGYLSIEREIAEGDKRNAEIVKTKIYLERLIKRAQITLAIKKLFKK